MTEKGPAIAPAADQHLEPESVDSASPDPVIEAYKRDLDLTLIRENLNLSVEERFSRLMDLQRFAEEIQRAGRAARRAK